MLSDIIKSGQTTDGRNVRIERTSSGFALYSDGSTPKFSTNLSFLEREMDKQVPNDSHHRDKLW